MASRTSTAGSTARKSASCGRATLIGVAALVLCLACGGRPEAPGGLPTSTDCLTAVGNRFFVEKPGCVVRRTLTIRNTCDVDLSLQSVRLDPLEARDCSGEGCPGLTINKYSPLLTPGFALPAHEEVLLNMAAAGSGGGTAEVALHIEWAPGGSETSRLANFPIQVASSARPTVHEEYAYWAWPMDVLLVIDDSAEMQPRREEVLQQLREFLSAANAYWRPVRVAVTTASAAPDGRLGALLGPAPGFIDLKTAEDVAHVVSLLESLPFSSADPPQPLAAMASALTDPETNGVARWLDPSHYLEVYLVSGRDDASPNHALDYLAPFRAALRTKTYEFPSLGSEVSVVLSNDDSNCAGTGLSFDRLEAAAQETNGGTFSFCEQGWGKQLMAHQTIWDLQFDTRACLGQPRDRDFPLVVTVDGEVWPATLPAGQELWTYDPVTNCINFPDAVSRYRPFATESLVLDYTAQPACTETP